MQAHRTQGKKQTAVQKMLAIVGIASILLALLTVGLHELVFEHTAFGMDFYTVYNAGRIAILERGNPYSDAVGQAVHMGLHNRYPLPGEDPYNFAYPVHSLLLVLPALWMELDWALAYWLAFNLVLLLILPALTLQGRRWPALALPFIPAFVSGLILGNNSVSVGVTFLAGWGLLTREEKPGLATQLCAGALLAWGTIKPQLIWAPLVFALLIALRRRLWGVLAGFGTASLVFLGLSWWITPGWPALWLARVREYSVYAGAPPLAQIYPANFLAEPVASMVGMALIVLGGLLTLGLVWRWWQGRVGTLPVLAWCGFYTFMVDPAIIITYQEIVLVIPILLWVLQPGISLRQAVVVWGLAFAVSWGLFIGSVLKINPGLFYQLPLLAYLPFLLWTWLARKKYTNPRLNHRPY